MATEKRGVRETLDLLAFVEALSVGALGNTAIDTAFRERNWAALGVALGGLASSPAIQSSGMRAYDGIREVPAELRDLDVIEGLDLGGRAIDVVRSAVNAYRVAHPE